MNLLLVIDFQNEFINEVTKNSLNELKDLIDSNKYDDILFTRFINSKDNPCYKIGWDGCLDEDSIKIPIDTKDYQIIDKTTYSAYNDELIQYIKNHNIENIYLAGFDIDCCVLATAFNLFENNYNTYVLKDYVYSCLSQEMKDITLDILERCIGKDHVI